MVEKNVLQLFSIMIWISIGSCCILKKFKSKIRDTTRDGKRPRIEESSKPKSMKRFINQDSSMGNKDRVSNKNSQGGGYGYERPRCTSCGKQNLGTCLVGMDSLYGCGNKGHKMRDCHNLKAIGKEVNKDHHCVQDPNSPKRNLFY